MGLFPKTAAKARKMGESLELTSVLKNTAPEGAVMYRLPEENFNTGSVLIVQPGEQAVFVRNGAIVSLFKEAGTYRLTTSNYPFLSDVKSLLTSGRDACTCQIYFVRTAVSKEMEFGCGLQARDPVLKFWTDLGVQGSFKVRISDACAFLTQVFASGRRTIAAEDLPDYFLGEMRRHVKACLSEQIAESGEEILGIEKHLEAFSATLHPRLNQALAECGLELDRFSVSGMKIKNDGMRRRQEELIAEGSTMGIIGDDRYRTIRALEIYEKAAGANSGMAGAVLNAGAGLEIGRQMGTALGQALSADRPASRAKEAGAAVCPACGQPVGEGDRFCRHCAAKLT